MNTEPLTYGSFEAKTKLAELLEKARRGASITITKHDRPVARLIGVEADQARRRAEATQALRTMRRRYAMRGLDVRKLRDEGRP